VEPPKSTTEAQPDKPPIQRAQSASANNTSNAAASEPRSSKATLPASLTALFARLDKLGRDKIKDAKFVTLTFTDVERGHGKSTENAWLVAENGSSITVMRDELIPWTYDTQRETTVPSSWNPRKVRLESVADTDFESLCRKLSKREEQPTRDFVAGPLGAPGPSYRLLLAHAAWKKGLPDYCNGIVAADETYRTDFEKYQAAVSDDLAWLHFLRGVNLLMFADRKEVLSHLRLVLELSPKGEFTAQSKDLLDRLTKLVNDEKKANKHVDESKLGESDRAEYYVSRFKDLRAIQIAQPGFISPYMAAVVGEPEQQPPTVKLKEMGMKAVPALINALDDDTPTRTVYHWRDFHRSRTVWRVSDFAWNILRDITHKEFGYQRAVGFTLSSMPPEQKRQAIASIQRWYEDNKNLSEDDRMLGFFSSHNPQDWITAGNYFLKQKNQRAVKPLLEKLGQAGPFKKGELCELLADFGDPSAKAPIH
jgi:hypothetical protein